MTTQPDLFSLPRPKPEKAFDGATYQPERDYERLDCQLGKVFRLMRDGQWRTLPEIARDVQGSQPAVSARLQDLRKDKYGGHTVDREHRGEGVFAYRVTVNRSQS